MVGALTLVAAPRPASGSPTPAATTQPESRAEQLLDQTGSKSCTVTAITSSSEQGVFIGVGLQSSSSATEAVTDDPTLPFEVTLTQGTSGGFKAGFGIGDPEIDGSAIATALLGYAASETYDVATQDEAATIVAFGRDPLGHHDLATLTLMAKSQQWAYSGYDASIGGSLSAFGALSASAGLGVQMGDAHSRDAYIQHITTVTGSLGAEADLGLSDSLGLNVVLTQDVLLDPHGVVVGVTDKATTDDGGAIGVASPDIPLDKAGNGGTVGEAVHTFAVKGPSSGQSVVDETSGTISFDDPAVRARGQADLAAESAGITDPVQTVAAALDLVLLMGSDGFVSVRRSVVDKSTTGIAVDAAFEVVLALDFTGSDVSTSLLDAEVITPDGKAVPWTRCQQLLTVHLRKVPGSLPGIGATLHDWLAAHVTDPTDTTYVVQDVCPPTAQPSCSGGFPINFDPGGPHGDLFQVVDPVEGSSCPIPFVASARASAERTCLVGEMLIVLPHAVSTSAADVLARSQLPADMTVAVPPKAPGLVSGEVSCQVWTSRTLAALPGLSDPTGSVNVGYFAHSVDLQDFFTSLATFGFGPPGKPYNPNDVVGIMLSVGNGRLAIC